MKRAWLTKFREAVTTRLGDVDAGEILAPVEGAEARSRLRRAQCIASALARLELRTDEAVVAGVLEACACDFSQVRIAAVRRVYEASRDLEDFWARLVASGLMEEFEVRDGWVLFTKTPYRPDLRDRYPDDAFESTCHCGSIVKPLHGRVSPAICLCGAGFYRPLFEALFGEPLRIEVRESLVQGDTRCVMAVEIPHTLDGQDAGRGGKVAHLGAGGASR